MTNMRAFVLSWAPVITICLTALVVLNWFRGNSILYFWDQTFPFNPKENAYEFYFSWFSTRNFGSPATGQSYLPFFVIIYLLHDVLDMSLSTSQAVLFYGLFSSTGLSIYFFMKDVYGKRGSNLVAALFYMFNLYFIGYTIQNGVQSSIWLIAYMPLTLLLFRRGLIETAKNGSMSFRYILYTALSTLLIAPSVTNWAFSAAVVPIFLTYYLFLILTQKANKSKLLLLFKYGMISFVSILLFNSWYFVPAAFFFSSDVILPSFSVLLEWLSGNAVYTTPLSVMRFIPNTFYASGPWPYFSWAGLYTGNLSFFTIISFFIPMVALFPLSSIRFLKNDHHYTFFLTLFVIYVTLAMGLRSPLPFGQVYLWLFMHINWFIIFTNNFMAWGLPLLFVYSLLFGRGMEFVHKKLRFRMNGARALSVVAILTILVVGIYPWPIWTGDMFPKVGDEISTYRVRIPSYFYNASRYMMDHPGGYKILALPKGGPLYSENWTYGYVGQDIFPLLSGQPTISTTYYQPTSVYGLYDVACDVIEDPNYVNTTTSYAKLLSALNVRYILLREDAYSVTGAIPPFDLERIESFLNRQQNISLVASFEKVKIYENEDFTPEISTSRNVFVFSPSPQYPYGIGWTLSNYRGTWLSAFGTLTMENKSMHVSFSPIAGKTFAYNPLRNAVALNVSANEYPYLLVTFSTNAHSTLATLVSSLADADFGGGYQYLFASNPTLTSSGASYNSLETFTLVYDLRRTGLTRNITYVQFQLASMANSNSSNLSLTIDDVKFVKYPYARKSDIVNFIINEPLDTRDTAIVADASFSWLTSKLNGSHTPAGLNFAKVNPTNYKVRITASTGPFILTLAQAYNTNWIAKVNNIRIGDEYHFPVNGYANGWLIAKEGSFEIDLEYSPQIFVDLGFVLTMITFLVMLTTAIAQVRKKSPHVGLISKSEEQPKVGALGSYKSHKTLAVAQNLKHFIACPNRQTLRLLVKCIPKHRLSGKMYKTYLKLTSGGHPDSLYNEQEQIERIDWLMSNRAGNTLEVGCATGFVTEHAGANVGLDVDVDRAILAKIKHPAKEFVSADACYVPFRGKAFDTVLIPEVLEHVSFKIARELIEECRRVGRQLLITLPNAEKPNYEKSPAKNPEHLWSPTTQRVRDLLGTSVAIHYTSKKDFILIQVECN